MDSTTAVENPPGRFQVAAHFLGLVCLQSANILLPLLYIPFVLRHIGPERFGLVTMVQVLMQYVGILADFGHPYSATRAVTLQRHVPEALRRTVWATMLGRAALIPCWLLLIGAIVICVPSFRDEWQAFAIGSLSAVGLALMPNWYFQGMSQVRPLAIATVGSRILAFIGILLFVRTEADYLTAIWLQSLAYIVASAIALAFVYPEIGGFVRPRMREAYEAMREGFPYLFAHAGEAFTRLAPTFALGFVANNVAVSHFTMGEKIANATSLVMGWPLHQLVYPKACERASKSKRDAVAYLKVVLLLAFVGSFLVSSALYMLREPLVTLIVGYNEPKTVAVLAILAWFPLLRMIELVLGSQTMPALELGSVFVRLQAIACIAFIPFVTALSYWYGETGTAYAVLLLEFALIVAMIAILVRWRLAMADVVFQSRENGFSS